MVEIALIIPVYNRKNITIEGLKNISTATEYYSVNGQGKIDIKIVLVDDGSTDGTSEWIEANRPDIYLLNKQSNLWWSGAINIGVQYAERNLGVSHVMLWNDDTICAQDYFFELEKVLLSDPKYAESILVSKIFWLNKNDQLFNFGAYYNSKTGKKTLIGLNQPDIYQEILKIDWSGGMGTLIPVKIINELEYLDNINLPQYHGDLDFFLRAKEKGYVSYAIPGLKIYNNAETTGLTGSKLKDLPMLFTSNRSLHNIKQNYYLNKRHSNTLTSWALFLREYVVVIIKSIISKH